MQSPKCVGTIGNVWPNWFVKNLVTRVAFFGILTLLASRASFAAEANCHILIDQRFSLQGSTQTLLPDSKFETLNSVLPDGIFSEQYEFKKSFFNEITRIFPTEDTYILTSRNSKTYLVFRSTRIIGGYKTTALSVPTPTAIRPLLCSDIQSWREELRTREQSVKGLVDHLDKTPTELTIGESLIDAEAGLYRKNDEEYSLDDLKKYYRQMLEEANDLVLENKSPLKQIEGIRTVLKKYGLGNYCRDYISFKDFVEKNCTNCQGESLLFAALILDLQVKVKPPLQFGLQVFFDHIRPVLYDGTSVVDLVLAHKGPDSGDPIFPLNALMYFALREQREEVSKGFLRQLVTDDLVKPLNNELALPQTISDVKDPLMKIAQIREAQIHIPLYDFSGIRPRTNFGNDPVDEQGTLDMGGSIENPTPEKRSHERGKGPGVYTTGVSCESGQVLEKFLNPAELKDVLEIRRTHYMTTNQSKAYGDHCPGYFLTDDLKNSAVGFPYLYIPPEVLKKMDISLSYRQKLEFIYGYYSLQLRKSIENLKTSFDKPLALAIKGLSDKNEIISTPEIAAADSFFNQSILKRTLLSNGELRNVMVEWLKSYVAYEHHLVATPEDTLDQLSKLDITALEPAEAFRRISLMAQMFENNHGPIYDQIVKEMTPDKSLLTHLYYPFSVPLSKLLLSDKMRLVLTPTEVSKIKTSLHPEEPMLTSVRPEEGPKVTLPQFPFPGGYDQLVSLCQKTQSSYYKSGWIMWPCPNHVDPTSEVFPKETQISEKTMLLILRIFEDSMRPRVLIRLLPGLNSHFIKNPEFKTLQVMEDIKFAIRGSFYFLSASNPTANDLCVTAPDPMCVRHLNVFTKVGARETQAPKWVKTPNDVGFWKLSVKTLYREFGHLGGSRILNRTVPSGHNTTPIINAIYTLGFRGETYFQENEEDEYSIMPVIHTNP